MKKALITGGSGDIGSALCYRLAENNIHVIVHSNHNYDKAQQIAEKINHQGGSAEAIAFDVCNTDVTAEAVKNLSESGLIQIIINNAGIHRDAPDVSLHGFYNVTQLLLMPMIQSRWGRIINISSVAGVMGNRGQCNYSAAKAALNGATKSLAQELASRKITVNAIEMIKNIVPMKRAGKPEEVAALAAFLCSDDASYISGQIININGAMA